MIVEVHGDTRYSRVAIRLVGFHIANEFAHADDELVWDTTELNVGGCDCLDFGICKIHNCLVVVILPLGLVDRCSQRS